MIIPSTDFQFGYRVWPDHVTFYATLDDLADLPAAQEIIEWCSEEFGPPYGEDSEGDLTDSWFAFLESPTTNIRVKSRAMNSYWRLVPGAFHLSFYLTNHAAKFRLAFNTFAAVTEK